MKIWDGKYDVSIIVSSRKFTADLRLTMEVLYRNMLVDF